MNYTRNAVVCIRLLVAFVGGFYAALKLARPELTPVFLLTSEDTDILANLPFATNPTFAKVLLVSVVVLSAYIILATLFAWRHEVRKYGDGLPSAPPGITFALFVAAMYYTYYAVLGITIGVRWYYIVSLAAITWILAIYELKQNDDYDVL